MKKAASLALAVALASGSMFAQAYQAGDLILRLGATTVAPNDDSDSITLPTEPATVLRGVEVDRLARLHGDLGQPERRAVDGQVRLRAAAGAKDGADVGQRAGHGAAA